MLSVDIAVLFSLNANFCSFFLSKLASMRVIHFCFKIYFKKLYLSTLFYDRVILENKEKESKIKRVDNCRPKFQRKYLHRPDEFVLSLAVLCEALSDIQLTFVWIKKIWIIQRLFIQLHRKENFANNTLYSVFLNPRRIFEALLVGVK